MICMLRKGVTAILATAGTIVSSLDAASLGAASTASISFAAPLPAHAAASPPTVSVARTGQWILASSGEIALVAGEEPHSGALLGIQCDSHDPRSRHLVFGIWRDRDRSGLRSVVVNRQTTFLHVAIETQTTRAAFVTSIEERRTLDAKGIADVVVAALTREQYQLMRAATDFTITAGKRTVRFIGQGSAMATASLRCAGNTPTQPVNLGPAHHEQGPVRPILTPWTFSAHLLAADRSEGRFVARTSAVGFASDPLARFDFAISCHGHRLYAGFTRSSAAQSGSGISGGKAEKGVSALAAADTVAEIYRDGRVIARFSVAIDATGKGHRLNARELTALLDFSNIVVTAPRSLQTITFTSDDGPQTITALAEACGTGADQSP